MGTTIGVSGWRAATRVGLGGVSAAAGGMNVSGVGVKHKASSITATGAPGSGVAGAAAPGKSGTRHIALRGRRCARRAGLISVSSDGDCFRVGC